MDMFAIRGGTPLSGRVVVGGAKNAALPIMAAALAVRGTSVIRGVPHLVDVVTLGQVMGSLGADVHKRTDGALEITVTDESRCVADYELVRRMRASFCVLGPMLARRGRACVSLPGGCNIGDRPIDLHLKGLRALGADIRIERGYVIAEARRLRGASIYLGGPFGSTVTGTCNVMAAAALAEGITTIEAAACEPEVADLGCYLNKMGARIQGLGTPFLRIEGVEELHGVEHTVIPDRIEAATLMMAAAITSGRVEIGNVCLPHMTAVVEKLLEIGVRVQVLSSPCATGSASVISAGFHQTRAAPVAPARSPSESVRHGQMHTTSVLVDVPGELTSADCIALPYPGIPTDVQAQLMALLTRVDGISIVTDKVFPDRFLHAPELVRLGARIRREGASAIVSGVKRLSGASVMASDLRASAALVIAALCADGDTVVKRIYHLDRGYARLEEKLRSLGAEIRRVDDAPANMPASLVPAVIDSGLSALDTWQDAPHELRGPNWMRGNAPREQSPEQPAEHSA